RLANLSSPDACRFCAEGALLRAAPEMRVENNVYPTGNKLLRELIAPFGLIAFNDAPTTTHPMIMRLFNKAIKRAKEQGI
ncbi:hypothetical protein LCGC14_2886680, partial [marine sediment metagenome]